MDKFPADIVLLIACFVSAPGDFFGLYLTCRTYRDICAAHVRRQQWHKLCRDPRPRHVPCIMPCNENHFAVVKTKFTCACGTIRWNNEPCQCMAKCFICCRNVPKQLLCKSCSDEPQCIYGCLAHCKVCRTGISSDDIGKIWLSLSPKLVCNRCEPCAYDSPIKTHFKLTVRHIFAQIVGRMCTYARNEVFDSLNKARLLHTTISDGNLNSLMDHMAATKLCLMLCRNDPTHPFLHL